MFMVNKSVHGGSAGEVQLALEMWRLLRAFERAISDLPAEKTAQRLAQLRYSKDRFTTLLDQAGLRLLVFDGQAFSAHLPVTPVNGDEVDAERASIGSTIEPSIVDANQVLHIGKVLLAETENVPRD
jgi:hypothetical protein